MVNGRVLPRHVAVQRNEPSAENCVAQRDQARDRIWVVHNSHAEELSIVVEALHGGERTGLGDGARTLLGERLGPLLRQCERSGNSPGAVIK